MAEKTEEIRFRFTKDLLNLIINQYTLLQQMLEKYSKLLKIFKVQIFKVQIFKVQIFKVQGKSFLLNQCIDPYTRGRERERLCHIAYQRIVLVQDQPQALGEPENL
jgi:hypothetical protein